MTAGLLGGLLLILGAWFVFKGEIYKSVGVYFLADIMWVLLSFRNKDYVGSTFIIIGMLLGLAAFIKMNYGQMRKDLKW